MSRSFQVFKIHHTGIRSATSSCQESRHQEELHQSHNSYRSFQDFEIHHTCILSATSSASNNRAHMDPIRSLDTDIGWVCKWGGGLRAPQPPLSFHVVHGLLSRKSRHQKELRQSHNFHRRFQDFNIHHIQAFCFQFKGALLFSASKEPK